MALAQSLRARTVTPLVRFEGLAGEFSQHDFGEVLVRYQDGTESKARARTTPERRDPLPRRRRQARQRRRLVRPGIDPAILGVAPVVTPGEPAPIEQPSEPWLHGGQDLRHVTASSGEAPRGTRRRRRRRARTRRRVPARGATIHDASTTGRMASWVQGWHTRGARTRALGAGGFATGRGGGAHARRGVASSRPRVARDAFVTVT